MKDPDWLIRKLVWYSKETDAIEGSTEILGVNLQDMQELWEQPNDNPMVDCFDVTNKQISYLQKYVDIKMDLDAYDYFIEACTRNMEKAKRDNGYLGHYPPPCR